MDDLPPLEEQVNKCKELKAQNPSKSGDKVYLIANQWFRKFEFFHDKELGKIDNSPLLKNGKLDPNMNSFEYSVLNKQVWEQLKQWYDGGPEIEVELIKVNNELRPILGTFTLTFHYNGVQKSIETHKYKNTKEIKLEALKLFEIPDDTEITLFDYFNLVVCEPLNESKLLIENKIIDSQDILIVAKDVEQPNKLSISKLHTDYENQSQKKLSKEEQVKIYDRLNIKCPIKLGEECYLISTKWLNDFKFSPNKTMTEIDNSSLLKGDKFDPNKKERVDFILITKPVWEQLVQWYGGGPPVPIEVIETSDGPKPNLPNVSLKFIYNNKEKKLRFSEKMMGYDLKNRVYELFNIPKHTEIRLILESNKGSFSKLDEDKDIYSQINSNNKEIRVDTKNDEGDWITDVEKGKDNYHSTSHYSGFHSSLYSSSSQASTPGVVGFSNLGNTCFFNSGTQCLVHTVALCNIFLASNWENDINETNPIGLKGNLARTFARLIKEVWSGNHSVITPHDLKKVISQFAPQFSGYQQHDSQELLTFMLDGLHEDLNRCKNKPLIDTLYANEANNEEIANKAWEQFKSRNNSAIVDHFYGQYRSTLYCPKCKTTTIIFEPFVTLSLPIKKPNFQKLKIIFIPKIFTQPSEQISIFTSLNPTAKDIKQAISKELGRDVNVVIATKTYYSKLNWGIESLCKSNHFYRPDIYAFEVDSNLELSHQFYIPCQIKLNLSYQAKYIGPFLLHINSDEYIQKEENNDMDDSDDVDNSNNNNKNIPTLEDIEIAAEQQLHVLWEPFQVSLQAQKEIDEFKRKTKQFMSETSSNSNNKFKAKIDSYPNTLEFDNELKYMISSIVSLSINPDFLGEDAGFSYEALLSSTVDVPETTNSIMNIEKNGTIQLENCFQIFSESDQLDKNNKWYCPNCKKFVKAFKKMDVWKVSDIFIIHLKRFSQAGYMVKKDGSYVEYPDTLDLSKIIQGPQKNLPKEELLYELYAVSEHMGDLGFGHYTAHAKVINENESDGQWYSFNDSSATVSNSANAHNGSAYVLFYMRKGLTRKENK